MSQSIAAEANQTPQTIPPGITEALLSQSRWQKPPCRLLSSFPSLDELTSGDEAYNKYQLLCPRNECRSVILQADIASLHTAPAVRMEPENIPAHSLLPTRPSSSDAVSWWLIQPNPMQFDNIGFSRAVDSLPLSPEGKKLKLLTCADCELGPLGWCEEGGTKFWLACDRVGYRV